MVLMILGGVGLFEGKIGYIRIFLSVIVYRLVYGSLEKGVGSWVEGSF